MSLDDKDDNGCSKMTRDNQGKAVGSIVVAVDADHRASQYALKWVVDCLLRRDSSAHRSIVLLNVCHSSTIMSFTPSQSMFCSNNNILEREPDDQEMEVLRPFRGFCTRRQIQFEIVVVEDDDVAQALVDYSIRHRVENLLLGAPSRNGFSRLFRHGSGIASTVVKWIPNFCSVYIISKLGKLKNVKNANLPTPSIPPLHHNTSHMLAVSTRGKGGSMLTFEFGQFPSSGASSPCSDVMLLSVHEDLECDNFHFVNQCPATSLFLTHKLESMEENMKRLKLHQNPTADLYPVVCKQAVPSNKKLRKIDNIGTPNNKTSTFRD